MGMLNFLYRVCCTMGITLVALCIGVWGWVYGFFVKTLIGQCLLFSSITCTWASWISLSLFPHLFCRQYKWTPHIRQLSCHFLSISYTKKSTMYLTLKKSNIRLFRSANYLNLGWKLIIWNWKLKKKTCL